MESEESNFRIFLSQKVHLDDDTIQKLLDGGFDDMDSLKLIDTGTMQLLGFQNHEQIYNQIRGALDGDDEMAAGILAQDEGDVLDLQQQMEEMKMQHSKKDLKSKENKDGE